jgi:hypothetical protein
LGCGYAEPLWVDSGGSGGALNMKNRGVGVHHGSNQVYIIGKTVIRSTRCR